MKKTLLTLSLIATALLGKAQTGAALNFDGSSDYVNLGTAVTNSIVNSTKLTVEAWVKPNNLGTFGCIAGNYGTGIGSGLTFLLRKTAATYEFFIGTGPSFTAAVSPANTATANIWQHVAGVYNGADIKIYINGVFSASVVCTATIPAFANPVWLGGNTANEYFPGEIDEVRIWKRALCVGEILNNKNGEIPTSDFGLLANYHFNQGIAAGANGAITTLNDVSGNLVTGTLTTFALTGATSNWITPGGVTSGSVNPVYNGVNVTVNSGTINAGQTFTMVPSGGLSYTFSNGSATVAPTISTNYTMYGDVTGGCLNRAVSSVSVNAAAFNFDGVNDRLNLLNGITNTLSSLNKITVEAWANPANTTGTAMIVGNHGTSGGATQFFLRRTLNQWEFYVNSVTGATNVIGGTATPNTWQHLAGVWNGSVMALYVNGVSIATVAAVSSSFAATTGEVWMADNTFSERLNGSIDEVRIWKRALCQTEIQNNMNGEIPTTGNGLLANYHFNQGFSGLANPTYSTVTDFSGNNFTGTLTNVALTGLNSNWIAPSAVANGSIAPTFAIGTFSLAASTNSICNGSPVSYTASGVASYSWSTGAVTNTISASPTITTVYSVIGTSSTGCAATLMQTLTVNQQPSITVNSGTICTGNSFTITPGGASTYTIQGGVAVVSPTTNSTYTVVGTSSAGCLSSNTVTANVTVDPCTGIIVNGLTSVSLNIYPNPTNGVFTIDLVSSSNVSVVNILGKVVYTKQLQEGKNNIDLGNLNTGFYFVKVESNGSVKTARLIKE